MARNNDRDRGSTRRAPRETGRRMKKKVCIFCKDHLDWVDYKDVNLLRKFMSDRCKIRARRVSGNCAQHQRDVATAIKTARELALLPYTQRTTSERPGGRGMGRGPGGRGPGGPRPTVPAGVDVVDDIEPDVEAVAAPLDDQSADEGTEKAEATEGGDEDSDDDEEGA
jgi:small subunit ribosomal protein S18